MNKYKCYYNRLVMEVHAETTLAARDAAAKRWGMQEKNAHKISVVLVNEDGTTDLQTA